MTSSHDGAASQPQARLAPAPQATGRASGAYSIEHERLVQRGLPLAEIVARRVRRRMGGIAELDELLGVCRARLVEIVVDFDPARGTFEGFVVQRLMWACLDSLRVNRRRYVRLRAAALAASERFASEPLEAVPAPKSFDDTAAEDQARAQLATLLEGHAAAMALALARAQNDVDAAPDPSEGPEDLAVRAEMEGGVREEVRSLPERHRALLERHYYGEERFDAIAVDLGLSKARVSRIHAEAIPQLARRLRVRFG